MKNIKTITLSAFCLCTAIAAQAQTDIQKPVDRPVVKVPVLSAQTPEMPNAPKMSTAAVSPAETPSPEARDKNQQPSTQQKPVTKIADDKEVTTPGGEEGRKIMAGKTTQPKPEVSSQTTIDTRPAPQVAMPRPVNGQQQL